MALHHAAAGTAVLVLALWTGAARANPPAADDPPITAPIVRPLVGSTIPEIVEQLGHPFMVTPLRETGGKLMFFENERGDRFIIETDITGRVIDAVVKHPESR
jgi:hypothetical protein